MYLGHFWHSVLQPEGEHRASHTCTTVPSQHEHTGCGAGAAAWRGTISPRDPFTLCRSDFTLAHLSDLFLSCRCSHTHVWKSPSHSYFHPETGFYKNCKFCHLTQLINLLLSSVQMRRWGGGWEGMCSQWPWACGSFIILLSSLTSSVLRNKSVFLCLLTQFCATDIDPPALGASSEFITIVGHLLSMNW